MLGGHAVTGRVAVVVPVFRNGDTLPELVDRLDRTLDSPWLLHFVDDACPDGSGEVATRLAATHPRVWTTRLIRNSGQHKAIATGLAAEPDADIWVCLDGDLQDPPEAVPRLLSVLAASAVAGVFAGRRGAYESLARRISGAAHRRAMSVISPLPVDAGAFFAMRRPLRDAVIDAVIKRGAPSVVAAAGASGLKLTSIPVERAVRPSGSSAWTARARVHQSARTIAWSMRHRPPVT